MERVQVGDVVRRIAGYSHGGHQDGHICTVTEITGENGTSFIDGTLPLTEFGNKYIFSAKNYELVSRAGKTPQKKRSGFGKWIARNEVPESTA